MVDDSTRDWAERTQALLEEAEDRAEAARQAQELAKRVAEQAYAHNPVIRELERRVLEVEASEAQERIALRPMLATVLENLQRLRSAADSHSQLLALQKLELDRSNPDLQKAYELAAVASVVQRDQLQDLAAEYSRLLSVAQAADVEATTREQEVLDELSAKDPSYRRAREVRVAARRCMADLTGAISALQEDRTEQVRTNVMGLDILWAKPAERTVGLSPAEAVKAYPALSILLDVHKERSAAPQARITPAAQPQTEE